MSAKIHITNTDEGPSGAASPPQTIQKERGRSLLVGSKPKYKTAKKAKEDGTTQVPLPELDEEPAAVPAEESKPASPEKPIEPVLSLDQQLKMKLDAEREEARLRKEAEEIQIAKDVTNLDLEPGSTKPEAEGNPPLRRVSVRDQMRKSCLIQDVNPDTMTEDELAEKIGSTFHSLWGAIGIKEQFAKVGDIAGKIKDVVHVDIHPSEVLERNTASFPRRKYRGLHHNIDKGGAPNPTTATAGSATAAPASGGRRGGMKQAVSDTFGLNPFHVLQLSSDEIDYFYGAFCEIGGAGPEDDAPSTVTLQQMVDWLYNVDYRFKTKDLKRNDPVLVQNIETVHYFDKKGAAKKAALIDASLLQGVETVQCQPGETGKAGNGATATKVASVDTDNISMSAKDVANSETKEEAMLRKKKESQERIQAQLERLENGQNTTMTFLDFVLSTWNFLTADEVVMVKNLFEYVEVGLLGNQDPVGIIPWEYIQNLGAIWHPESPKIKGLKVSNTKRKKNKLSGMIKAMEELAYVDKETGKKSLFLGNFVGWCQKNRSFGSNVMRLQMDMYACLMGHSFWKRQSRKRSERFGISNLHFCLKDHFLAPDTLKMLNQRQMEETRTGKTATTKREDIVPPATAEEEENEMDAEAAEGGEAHGKTWEEVEKERVEEAKSNVLKRKSRIRLGKTILMIEDKKLRGLRLNGEESWLYAKMVAQAKTANKLYTRQSVVGVGSQSVNRKIGLKRAKAEEDEEDEEAVDEDDKEIIGLMTLAENEKEEDD